ncbi:nitrate/nitrite transporter [Pseudoduganella sp. UC29_106]|uniref:MFS transporter n=1 Tax=Pseudoduganella sp. UC29_106 TaxID=3374553 RepID=UPI003757FBCA
MMTDDSVSQMAVHRRWVVFYLATVFAMMTMQMSSLGFSPLLPDIQREFEMSFSQMGMFTGIYGIVALIVSIPAGIMAKQYGEKKVLAVGLFILALGLLGLSFAENFGEAITARAVWIFGYRLAFVCVMTAIALTAPPNLKGRAMGVLGAASALATVVGAPFCAEIAKTLGWRHAIMGFGAMAIVGMLVFVSFYKQRAEVTKPGAGGSEQKRGAFSAFRVPIVWTIPLLGLTNAGGFAATFFLPSVLKAEFNMDATAAAGVISIAYIVAIFVNPLCGYLADRFNRWLVLAGMMLMMIPASLGMMSHNILVFQICATGLISLGLASTNQLYPTIAELMRGRDVGPLMGITALGGGIFGYLGPQALGWLRDWSGGFTAGWYALTGVAAFAACLILFLKGYADRNNARLARHAAMMEAKQC